MIELIIKCCLDEHGEPLDISNKEEEVIEFFFEEDKIAISKTHEILKVRRQKDRKFYVIKKELSIRPDSTTTMVEERTDSEYLIQQCRHDNLVQYVMDGTIRNDDSGSSPKAIVMEHIEGQNLYDYIKETRKKPLDKSTALNYIFQIADALIYLHNECGIVHRDVKPKNVMCREESVNIIMILIDFDIAQKIGTKMQKNLGTPGYKPRNSLHRATTDIYGLGMLLYFLLTAKDPTEDLSIEDIQDRNFGEDIELFFAKILPINELTEDDF